MMIRTVQSLSDIKNVVPTHLHSLQNLHSNV
jgi:hypothetical protein